MGTCCSSRTDIDGKVKGEKKSNDSKDSKEKVSKKTDQVKFNVLDEVKNTINEAMRDSKYALLICSC